MNLHSFLCIISSAIKFQSSTLIKLACLYYISYAQTEAFYNLYKYVNDYDDWYTYEKYDYLLEKIQKIQSQTEKHWCKKDDIWSVKTKDEIMLNSSVLCSFSLKFDSKI